MLHLSVLYLAGMGEMWLCSCEHILLVHSLPIPAQFYTCKNKNCKPVDTVPFMFCSTTGNHCKRFGTLLGLFYKQELTVTNFFAVTNLTVNLSVLCLPWWTKWPWLWILSPFTAHTCTVSHMNQCGGRARPFPNDRACILGKQHHLSSFNKACWGTMRCIPPSTSKHTCISINWHLLCLFSILCVFSVFNVTNDNYLNCLSEVSIL
jgi:hypothetical protein